MNKNIFKISSITSFILMSITLLAFDLDAMVKRIEGGAISDSNGKATAAFVIIFALISIVTAVATMIISFRDREGNMHWTFGLIIILAIVGLAWGSLTIDIILNPMTHVNSGVADGKFVSYSVVIIPLLSLIALPLPIIDTVRSW